MVMPQLFFWQIILLMIIFMKFLAFLIDDVISIAFEIGNKTQAICPIRPSQVGGHSPERAMDARQLVQRQRACVEPRDTSMSCLFIR